MNYKNFCQFIAKHESEDRHKPKTTFTLKFNKFMHSNFVKRHNIMDEHYTQVDMGGKFVKMTGFTARQTACRKYELKIGRACLRNRNRTLRHVTKAARQKLASLKEGQKWHLKQIMANHKKMQWTYMNMPLHMVDSRMDHQTFVMRKERDRLRVRVEELKKTYKKKLLEKGQLEDVVKYELPREIPEELSSNILLREIENSNLRSQGYTIINSTFKKMVQILHYDAMFYDGILESLDKDIEEQANFIKYIISVTKPKLNVPKIRDYTKSLELTRKNLWKSIARVEIENQKRVDKFATYYKQNKDLRVNNFNQYMRRTSSMNLLSDQLNKIEDTMKTLHGLCLFSHPQEIPKLYRGRDQTILALKKQYEREMLNTALFETKIKRCSLMSSALDMPYFKEQEEKVTRINQLNASIDKENQIEMETLKYLKDRANVFVLLRYSMWGLVDILRYVGNPLTRLKPKYPSIDLDLPLLQFDGKMTLAYPPSAFEENMNVLIHEVILKVKKLMKYLKGHKMRNLSNDKVQELGPLKETYHNLFMNLKHDEDYDETVLQPKKRRSLSFIAVDEVPSRNKVKNQSKEIVDRRVSKTHEHRRSIVDNIV